MPVRIPSFANLNPRPGLNEVPSSAIAAYAAGQGAYEFARGITENAQQKRSLRTLADSMESFSPETASIVRAQADAIPTFALPQGGGGGGVVGGGSRSGGAGGAAGGASAVQFALKQVADEREFARRLQFEELQNQNALGRIGATSGAGFALAGFKAGIDTQARQDAYNKQLAIDNNRSQNETDVWMNTVGTGLGKTGGSLDFAAIALNNGRTYDFLGTPGASPTHQAKLAQEWVNLNPGVVPAFDPKRQDVKDWVLEVRDAAGSRSTQDALGAFGRIGEDARTGDVELR